MSDKLTNSRWQLTGANRVYLRGAENFRLKKYAAAIQDFDEAVGLEPNIPFFYLDRAVAKHCLNEISEALADVEKGIQLGGDYHIYRNALLCRAQLTMNP